MPYPTPPRLALPDPWIVDDLRLRLPTADDVDAITRAVQDADVLRFTLMPSPYVRADAEGFVAGREEALADGAAADLIVVDVHDQLLGGVGVTFDWRDAQAELGYWLTPAARGRAIITRAARAVAAWAFETGAGRVWLRAAATNPRSNAVARRLGFTHEGTLRSAAIDGASGDLTAPRVDMHLWGLLPGELT
jgi:RimJ/RimL family protein N-acetyltransferase